MSDESTGNAEPNTALKPSCVISGDGQWFVETVDGEERRFRVSEVLFQARTAFQDLLLLDTPEYGKMLVIDGETQSAQEDEYIYHEALVQPAMLALNRGSIIRSIVSPWTIIGELLGT